MMTNKLLFIVLISFFFYCSKAQQKWDANNESEYVDASNNPAMWNLQLFEEDVKDQWNKNSLPFNQSPIPVVKYRTLGMGYRIGKLLDNKFACLSYWVNETTSENTADYLPMNVVSIIVHQGKYKSAEVISRNHPNYVGHGHFKAKVDIDWVATKGVDDSSICIINGRYFNLNLGNVIIVYPDKKNIVRFYQVRDRLTIASKDINAKLEDILNRKEIKNFHYQVTQL